MKLITRWLLLYAACVLLLTASQAAFAQGGAAAAEALFEQGRAELEAGYYDSACAKFRESDKLDPAPGTKFNLADCEEQRGNLATAWELFKAVEGDLDPSDERYAIAQKRRQAVEPRVPKLEIVLAEGAPETTTVRIGEVELGKASFGLPIPLDPGQHELVVTAPQYGKRHFTVTLTEGMTSEIAVAPGERVEPSAASGPAPVRPSPIAAETSPQDTGPQSESSSPLLGYVLGGVGVAGLVVGGITGIMALGDASTADEHCWDTPTKGCDQEGVDANSSGKTLATVSTVGFVMGVLGVGVGTYLILSNDGDGASETALVTKGGPTGGHVSLVHRW